MRTKSLISKIVLLGSCLLSTAGCAETDKVTLVSFDENYQSVWRVGEIDFSALKFHVTHANGVVEDVPVDVSMVNEKDLYKFYEVGEWKVKINYNSRYYNVLDFVIVENEFDDNIVLKDQVIAYDGKTHGLSIEGPLPEGTNVYFPYGNNFTMSSVNPYQVKAVLSKEGYKTKELTGKLTITQSDYSKEILDKIVFEDFECEYDGHEKKIEATNLPSDISIEYFIGNTPGNSRTNAGEYTVIGKLTCSNSNYLPIPNIEATLKINKAKYKLDDITFEDKVVIYQPGVKQNLTLTNEKYLPSTLVASYSENAFEDVGEHEVTVSFVGDPNFEDVEPMTATLTILPLDIDLKDVVIEKPQSKKFDGKPKDYFVNVPSVVKVVKEYVTADGFVIENPVDVGVYRVKLSYVIKDQYKAENFNIINAPTDEGLLTIERKSLDLSNLNFGTQETIFDGEAHDFIVEKEVINEDETTTVFEVPEELEIKKDYYLNGNKVEEVPTEVGEYLVRFTIGFKETYGDGTAIKPSNYNIINTPTESGTLKIKKIPIDMSGVKIPDQTKYYNYDEEIFYDLEEVPEGVTPTIQYYQNGEEINKITQVGKYDVAITFNYNKDMGITEDHYEMVNVVRTSAVLTVAKRPIDMSNVDCPDVTKKWTGGAVKYTVDDIINYNDVKEFVDVQIDYFDKTGEPLGAGAYPVTQTYYSVRITFTLKEKYSSDSFRLANYNSPFFAILTVK